jgi:GTP-binding protein
MSRYPKARFLKSAVSPESFGDDSGYEVAISGRSNSGKSSALNAIVRRRDLARTSRTPGRTQSVNLFELEPGRRLVDLPGYGHARVPDAVKAAWARLMDAYFAERRSLAGLLIVVDARRGIGERDEAMLRYATARREERRGRRRGAGGARADAVGKRKNARRSVRTAGPIPGLGMQSG